MSYDIDVFAVRPISRAALIELAGSTAELSVDPPLTDGSIAVRGRGGRHAFHVDGPLVTEAEDLPDEVFGLGLGVVSSYSLYVDGDAAAAVADGIAFARRLAGAVEGVAYDRPAGQLWTASGPVAAPAPVAEQVIDIVDLDWYVDEAAEPPDLAASYLALCRRLLPEALPRRFGVFEPLSGRLDRDGDAAFAEARDGDWGLFFLASYPCFGGSLAPRVRPPNGGPTHRHTLTVARAALADAGRRAALQTFFVEFALTSQAFYGTGEVQRGHYWNGRQLWAGSDSEGRLALAQRGHWQGPPDYPVWWTWDGAFHARRAEPADRDQLAALD